MLAGVGVGEGVGDGVGDAPGVGEGVGVLAGRLIGVGAAGAMGVVSLPPVWVLRSDKRAGSWWQIPFRELSLF